MLRSAPKVQAKSTHHRIIAQGRAPDAVPPQARFVLCTELGRGGGFEDHPLPVQECVVALQGLRRGTVQGGQATGCVAGMLYCSTLQQQQPGPHLWRAPGPAVHIS